MAGPRSGEAGRAGRTLLVFFAGLLVTYGLVALAGQWKPTLGLDLQGGTRITLIAKGDDVKQESLKEAQAIIDQRVNGSGVAEAEVTTQGNRFIVVEIPGETRADLVDTVKRQAQLRFRVVAQTSLTNPGSGTQPVPSGEPTGEPTGFPAEPQVTAPAEPTATASGEPTEGSTDGESGETSEKSQESEKKSGKGNNRAPSYLGADKKDGDKKDGDKKKSKTGGVEPKPTSTATPTEQPTGVPTEAPTGASTEVPAEGGAAADDPLAWMLAPDAASAAAFEKFSCPAPGEAPQVDDDPTKPLVTCDQNGIKYLLSVAMLEGDQLTSAKLRAPDQQNVEYGVSLAFDGPGSTTFGTISDALYGTDRQFAIVLDGQVISAPTMNAPIHDGQADITGDFSQAEAQSLATSLRFGALPIAFEGDPSVETVGPSLAGDQLSAGLFAGAIGLGLVMLYCLFYYRGLGVVVLASLVVAALLTYGLVLLLSKTAGFALTLPGIAGLIVAVGITADSFVVYFERIRDEMRDGKSMRVAVQAGWKRARMTCLAADTVSLLAAVVLYIFAAGVVKGFAFALGLSTLIDLAVIFWFTHPMITWLARFKFFNAGHRLSGLSAETLGVDALPASVQAAGGKA